MTYIWQRFDTSALHVFVGCVWSACTIGKFMRINCWLLLRQLWLCQGFFLHPGELGKDIHSSCTRLLCKCRLTSRSVGCWSSSCFHWRTRTVVDLWRAALEWKGLEEYNRKDRTAVPIVKSSVKVWKWKWRYVFRSFLFGMLSGNDRTVFASARSCCFASWPRNTACEYCEDLFDWISMLVFDLLLAIVVFQYLSPEGLQKVEQTNCLNVHIDHVSLIWTLLHAGFRQKK